MCREERQGKAFSQVSITLNVERFFSLEASNLGLILAAEQDILEVLGPPTTPLALVLDTGIRE